MRLLAALARLKAEGLWFEMALAGDGPLRPVLESEIRRLGLERRVRITGWLSNEAIRREIVQARVVVLPSFAENLPVVEYAPPERFDGYRELGESMGFRHVFAGPFVRSSYRAEEALHAARREGEALNASRRDGYSCR